MDKEKKEDKVRFKLKYSKKKSIANLYKSREQKCTYVEFDSSSFILSEL